jgi:hypothetical protein
VWTRGEILAEINERKERAKQKNGKFKQS